MSQHAVLLGYLDHLPGVVARTQASPSRAARYIRVRSGFGLILGAAEDVEVVAATDGADVVRAVRRERPHVVLLDIRMPDVDGLTVLRELRKLPDAPAPLSAATDDEVFEALRLCAAPPPSSGASERADQPVTEH